MLKAFLNATRDKYKKVYINSYKEYRNYYSELGVVVVPVNSFFYRAINKIRAVLHKPQLYYHYPGLLKVDFIMLGGSLFAESDNYDINQNQFVNLSYAANKSSDAYVIGCNFGPYKSKEFLGNYDSLFRKCKDVCLEIKSYNLTRRKNWQRCGGSCLFCGNKGYSGLCSSWWESSKDQKYRNK